MSAKQYGIPTPIQFDRLYAGPLDKHEVFDSYAEALVYAQGPISYPGQTIGVKKSGLKEDVYVINQDKSLSRLMIQREDIRVVLYADKWEGEVPYEQTVIVPYLEATDNCIISLGEAVNDPEVVREIVNAKIGDTIQEEGSIRFIARGDKPTVDIPITITIGSIVSAVEIPNNVNDNTNHTVVIAEKDKWVGDKPPYTQDLYVFGVRPDSNGTVGINPDSSYYKINQMSAATSGVLKYGQKNNYVTIAAMNSKPTRDLEVLVVWGDEIVVFENSDTFEDFNKTVDLVLLANEWTRTADNANNVVYDQTLIVPGLGPNHTGAIGLSDDCTLDEAEVGLNAELELISQSEGSVTVRANGIKPIIDLPIYLTYGSNITIVPSPEYVGEANRHIDTTAFASKWVKSVDGWEQEVEVEGITSNSIGTMGLRNGATELQAYSAAVSKIKISKVYDNKVLLTATKGRPIVNLPLCFVFGRNINVAKYPGVMGKVSLNTDYILFDDSKINSGLSTLQQLLEYLQKYKINYSDIVDSVHNGQPLSKYLPDTNSIWKYNVPMSARMGSYLYNRKINYDDIINNLNNESTDKPLSAKQGNVLNENINELSDNVTNSFNTYNARINTINDALGQSVIRVAAEKPDPVPDRNVIWIKSFSAVSVNKYTVTFEYSDATAQVPITNFTDVIENSVVLLPKNYVLTKPDYEFKGWTVKNGDGTLLVPGTQFTVSSNMTLVPVWLANMRTVILDGNEATNAGITKIQYRYGIDAYYDENSNPITNITNSRPTKDGHTFNGYFNNGVEYITSSGLFTNNLYNKKIDKLTAEWTATSYTVSFNANAGTGIQITNMPSSQLEEFDTPLILSDKVPVHPNGFTFLGWTDDANSDIVLYAPGSEYRGNEDITLYAVWTHTIYQSSLIANNDTEQIVFYRYNTDDGLFSDPETINGIDSVDIPILEGYNFKGYYSGIDGTGTQYIDENGRLVKQNGVTVLTRVKSNNIIYAKWEPKEYEIVFDVNGGQGNYNTIYTTYGETVTLPIDIPTKNGERFAGWSTVEDEYNTYDNGSSYIIDEEIGDINTDNGKMRIVLYARWNKIYEVSLYNDETLLDNIYYIHTVDGYYTEIECINKITTNVTSEGLTQYIVDIPTSADNKTFLGYYTKPVDGIETQYTTMQGIIINSLYHMPENISLYAKWA